MRGNKGFTLLEILLGMALTALILGIIFASLRLSHRSEEKARERHELAQKMRVIPERLAWLVRGSYPYTYKKEDKRAHFFDGQPESLTLVTTSTDPFSAELQDLPGLKLVKIYLDDDGLKVEERLFYAEKGGVETLLSADVKALKFRYMDPADEGEPTWSSEWNGEDKEGLPGAVEISLTLKHGEKEIELPDTVARIRTAKPYTGPLQK